MTGSGLKTSLHCSLAFMTWSGSGGVQPGVPERLGMLEGSARVHPVSWCLSDLCVVLIAESPLGLRVRSATWGTGSGSKFREEISDGGAPNETLDRERRGAPWLRGGPAQR
jgi:hypothetical protein